MWDLYVSTATSDECSADSTVNGYSVYIFTSCDANKVKDLAEALPNCYYHYESMNKKQDVLDELDDCEESFSYTISVTLFPDSTIETASSSASSGKSNSEPLVSGDPSDVTLDSSSVAAESAAPRDKLQLWTIAILVTATILAF